ncbi:MAG: tol-pal system protein YbgF [Pseudomonadota bacterium]
MFRYAVSAALSAFCVIFSGAALAQTPEIAALADRLNRLERSLSDVQAEVYQGRAGGAASGAALANVDDQSASRILVQLADLQREIARITGDLEELRFEQRQTSARLEKFMADTEFRLQGMGAAPGAGGLQPAGAPQSLTGDAPSPAASGPTPLGAGGAQPSGVPANVQLPDGADAAFDYAYGLLLRGDYNSAEAGLSQFLDTYPNHPKAPEAQHRLGEIFFVRGDYAGAAAAFLKNVQDNPQSGRAPESLLRLGMALAQLGEKGEACKTFNALPGRYPNASENLLQRAETEKARAGC